MEVEPMNEAATLDHDLQEENVTLATKVKVLDNGFIECITIVIRSESSLPLDKSRHWVEGIQHKYNVGEQLGKGSYAPVYAAVDIETGRHEREINDILSRSPRSDKVVETLKWETCVSSVTIMVQERPIPCMDLQKYCESKNGRLCQSLALKIMRQVVEGCQFCFSRGVCHNDIKSDNILINTETFNIKLIDFGCGKKLETDPSAKIKTICSLGRLLYILVCGQEPAVHSVPQFPSDLSEDCQQLIRSLDKNSANLPTLEDILNHRCFVEEADAEA
ncbi:hypothetical protein QTP70_002871 [Hemibagrus guttatus]|uniref:non-specific serine/threonine protein kinase n=1 Tax=Hemibagrus guttatus TaxID=175788 RepID=A0AAE0QS65_9TELE|nr:hypothetical protein QTP70_002871 [Hemibagrus guttatus]